MPALRQALCRQRRAVHHPRRDRCRGLREHHRPVALASELRVPLLAAGRDRPPVARLFDTTPYGISVWVCMLYERFVCCRPLHRVAAWLADMGLVISPGTLADSIKRFVPLFEPLAEEILAHQNEAALRHADETSWRVQAYREKGRSSRAWLWTSVSPDAVYFHIDPSRSAEVAMKLFGSTKGIVVLVCDRYSAYKKLARELAGKVILRNRSGPGGL